MKFLILLLSLVISGCATTKPQEPIVSHKLISNKLPEDLLIIPPLPAAPDLNGSQKGVSFWLIENETRIKTLENQLKKIKRLNDEQL